jgi:hypothetical protein
MTVLIATWTVGNMTYKFFELDRESIDEGSDENNAHDLVGIESRTNLRLVNERFDGAFGRRHLRPGEDERIDAAIAAAPEVIRELMSDYGWQQFFNVTE